MVFPVTPQEGAPGIDAKDITVTVNLTLNYHNGNCRTSISYLTVIEWLYFYQLPNSDRVVVLLSLPNSDRVVVSTAIDQLPAAIAAQAKPIFMDSAACDQFRLISLVPFPSDLLLMDYHLV